jgi:hypothetical protein
LLNRKGTGHKVKQGAIPTKGRHHMAAFSPKGKIRTFGIDNIAEGRMPRIAGTAQHRVVFADPAREKYPVPVEKHQRVFHIVDSPVHTIPALIGVNIHAAGVSSQWKTPAKPSLQGTTALLKMLFECTVKFRGMTGFPE